MTARPLPPLLLCGDCIARMRDLPDASIDAIVTDPPYGLEFMGKGWDRYTPLEFEQWCASWAAEALRVLKPGGHLLAFGGSRTWHRLAAGIEDAGFEVRDSIAWLYGSGFPKSLDVSKAIDKAAGAEREVLSSYTRGGRSAGIMGEAVTIERDVTAPATPEAAAWQGWGTALKPAFEPIVVARKPLVGTVAANVLQYGTGALNIDGSRIGTAGGGNACPGGDACRCVTSGVTFSPTKHPERRQGDFGRWPANVMLDESQAAALDVQTGVTKSPSGPVKQGRRREGSGWDRPVNARTAGEGVGYGDTGGASRFFFVARGEGASVDECHTSHDGETASIAGEASTPPSPRGASALGDAATSAPLDISPARSSALFTNETPTASSLSASSGTPMTPSTEDGYSPESPLVKRTRSGSRAKSAEDPGSDTMRTTTSPSRSSGTADPTTFGDTSSSMALGEQGSRFMYVAKAPKSERPVTVDADGKRVAHPTVKPLALMRYLCKLVTPPGGVVLDPFAGSGTTLEAAHLEGFEAIGVELTPDYWPLVEARIERAVAARQKGADRVSR